MIQFISVSKIYPNQYQALDNISFEIAEGEFVFLIGPSGSGKTTIIRHLIREELPSEGRIYFDNEDITRYKRRHVYELRRKIGVVFQDYKLIQDKNTYENIAFAMEAAGKGPKDIEETVPYVLDIVGLLDKAYAFPDQLSGGEKQRVAIARAISNNPKLLIADEPTGNLDPDAAWDIVQILTKINNWGTTVIMATHGSGIVDALGKRVIALVDGRIIKDVLKGTYKDIELQIDKEKRKKVAEEKKEEAKQIQPVEVREMTDKPKEEKKEEPKKEKKMAKEKKKEQEQKKEDVKEKEKKPEKELKVEKKPLPPEPTISLTQRRKAKKVENDKFEEMVQKSIEPLKKEKEKELTSDTDIKDANLNPKLGSILKAYGYTNIGSLQEAGYNKIAKIENLSAKDLKTIQELINIKK